MQLSKRNCSRICGRKSEKLDQILYPVIEEADEKFASDKKERKRSYKRDAFTEKDISTMRNCNTRPKVKCFRKFGWI